MSITSSFRVQIIKSSLIVLAALAVGCNPSEADKTMFDRKIELDSQQADIIKNNISDCAKLQTDLTTFRKANGAEMKDLQAQFGSLSDGKKDKLIESKQAAWDKTTDALIHGAAKCNRELVAGLEAG